MRRPATVVLATLVVLAVLFGWVLSTPPAQAGSLYSVFGLGQTSSFVSGQANGMGGAGVALADVVAINALNPAAERPFPLTRVSATFLYEGVRLRTTLAEGWHNYASPAAFRLNVPLGSAWAVTAGFQPVSLRDYSLRAEGQFEHTWYGGKKEIAYSQEREGSGGLSALSMDVCRMIGKRVSVGLGGRFIYGTLKDTWRLTFSSEQFRPTEDQYSLHARGASVVAGVLVEPVENLRVGGFYQTKANLTLERRGESRYVYSDTVGTVRSVYPATVGIGVYAGLGKSWTLVADFRMQDWHQFRWDDREDPLAQNAWRVGGGVQFAPPVGMLTSFWKRIQLRAGAYRQILPFTAVQGKTLDEKALTFGLGVPLPEGRGRLDVAVAVGRRGNTQDFPVEETFVRTTVTFVGAEKWFIKLR